MNKRIRTLFMTAGFTFIFVIVGAGFLLGPDNPVLWLLLALFATMPFIFNRSNKKGRTVWKDEYSVGVQVLDNDHKKLIRLLNVFQTAYDYEMGDLYEEYALKELMAYTKYHFEREEKLMEDSGYPEFENHKKQHARKISEINEHIDTYYLKGQVCLYDLSMYLEKWLINHINGTDKKYSKFFQERRNKSILLFTEL